MTAKGPGRRLTLATFVDETWAPLARRRLAAKTWERDAIVYRRHILPALGFRPITAIDVEDLVEWQDGLERAGVGSPTMLKAMGMLSSIFGEAARRPRSTGVTGNPVALLAKPRARRRRRPLVWGPVVVERVRYQLLVNSLRIGPARSLAAMRDALLVSLMAMTGCRPGEALALRWSDAEGRVSISHRLSGTEIIAGTKTGGHRGAPLLAPLAADLAVLRERDRDSADDWILRTPAGGHWVETDWRNYRRRHFTPALERVEAEWGRWRQSLPSPDLRESVAGLASTRPYDLGRHTHSALMLASGMSLQRLARIQGHGLRVLDETYSEQLESASTPSARSSEPGRSSGVSIMTASRLLLRCFYADDGHPRPRRGGEAQSDRPRARHLLQGGAEFECAPRPGKREGRFEAVPTASSTTGREARSRPRQGAGPCGRARGCGDPPQARPAQVKLPDVNLLLYAIDEQSPKHDRAHPWLEEALSGTEAVAFCWAVLLGFVRISTHAAIFENPLRPDEALDYIDAWLDRPCATTVAPTVHHPAVLRRLLGPLGVGGNLVSDAHLAALAIEHGAELCSSDTDFARFEGLRWRDPLR
jgi:uncharacterized protein